jgi:hypothetical protein
MREDRLRADQPLALEPVHALLKLIHSFFDSIHTLVQSSYIGAESTFDARDLSPKRAALGANKIFDIVIRELL